MQALAGQRALPCSSAARGTAAQVARPCLGPRSRRALLQPANSTGDGPEANTKTADLEKELARLTKQTASTFAPRPSTATKNPAFKGSVLYDIFEWQAWISMVAGGLLSYNVLLPTEEPSIPRLLGMWSIWMFTVPSLRARECLPKEKDALNLLFLAIPLMNITLPFIWKSFPFIFTANAISVFAVYYWKGVWKEVYGIPFEAPGASSTPSASEEVPPQ